MREIEKLAREYALHVKATDSPQCDPVNVAHDWMEGFRKAREMALEALDAGVDPTGRGWDAIRVIGETDAK